MTSFLVASNTTQTTAVNMAGSDDLTVQLDGTLEVGSGLAAVLFNAATNGALITNAGTIRATGAFTAGIDFFGNLGTTLNATINNTGDITGEFDAIRLSNSSVNTGTVSITNNGGIVGSAGGINSGKAIDFGLATGSFLLDINNGGNIFGVNAAAIVIGASGNVTNNSNIAGGFGNYFADGHAIQYMANATGTVTNNTGGVLQGDQHAIFAGASSAINVINNTGAQINGFNGAGIRSLGSVTVLNHNVISGLSNAAATDLFGPGGFPDGIADGDTAGIDVDGLVSVDNYGGINGFAALGHAADNLLNVAEGINAGGGDITNRASATIFGQDIGIFIADGRTGNSLFLTTITNSGNITSITSYGIQIIGNFADAISNFGTISGGGGTAILFGAGDNTLVIGNDSVINGLSDGGGGANTLDYSQIVPGSGGITVDLAAGTAFGTGGVVNFNNVTGSANGDTLTGNSQANTINGGDQNDTIRGGLGADTLNGEGGDDTIFQDGSSDSADGGTGIDTINGGGRNLGSAATFNLSIGRYTAGEVYSEVWANFENYTNLSASGVETVIGTAGANIITTGGGANIIVGGGGADQLNGGGGIDNMSGGDQSDTYFADVFNDIIFEANAVLGLGGDDLVNYSGTGTFTLSTNVERLTLTHATANVNGTGNELANTLIGNTKVNVLSGLNGNDTLNGGADNLTDILIGGIGNDTYVLGNGNDTVTEAAGNTGGIDTATSTIARSLSVGGLVNVENLIMLGAGLATGNGLNNSLDGSQFAGANTLRGLAGNDVYTIGAGDIVDETFAGSAGVDTVRSLVTHALGANVEHLVLLGTAVNGAGNGLANTITGNAVANGLNGGGGIDTINGGLGNDTLVGGIDNDSFVINTAPNGTTNVDRIIDLNEAGNDTILLENTGAGLFNALALGALAANAYTENTTGLATAATHRIIYEIDTGKLTYDSNGSAAGGTIVHFATLDANNAALYSNADFLVI